ncbi:YbdD/YjiX family protein [Pseudonocardia sp. TRM90224]|uniref:YbdD/YjiX family protein n=1 Tax=Pseudonocardia sp. TRM90224 TaxID=2812678 RepID=UPI001E3D2C7C|nr:YbdD/YjiX family protein [Pseudonocardia sp. TRM90224]
MTGAGSDRLKAGLRDAWQVVRGIAGERAYEEYLAHQAAHHPGEPVLGEREFWRKHVDRGDTGQAARCC